jgi:hypothetical protein
MGCVSSVTFAVLVNGAPTDFFRSHRGLRQGCPLSPLLFLLVVEGLNRILKKACTNGKFKGIKVYKGVIISHLLFMDGVLILGADTTEEWLVLKELLTSFFQGSSMEINWQKSCFLTHNLDDALLKRIEKAFEIPSIKLDQGMKYLGFHLKPNDYRVNDWLWHL